MFFIQKKQHRKKKHVFLKNLFKHLLSLPTFEKNYHKAHIGLHRGVGLSLHLVHLNSLSGYNMQFFEYPRKVLL